MLFSVIIPTFNRCGMLDSAIASVSSQSLPGESYEIIVVDNASTDGTRELVQHLDGNGKRIRYAYEVRPGLHWARHAGARLAKGDVLVYTDDDVIVHPDWLSNLARAYTELDADSAGGKIDIEWDKAPPDWVYRYEGILGKLDYGMPMCLLRAGQFINGGNFSIKRHRLFEAGGFNPDQIGDHLVGDGETGLCRKIHEAGWKMAWVPDALVRHRQLVARNASLNDMKRRFANNGVCAAYAYYRATICSRRHLLRIAEDTAWKGLVCTISGLKYRSVKHAIYYQYVLNAAFHWAESRYYFRLVHDGDLRRLVMRKDWITD